MRQKYIAIIIFIFTVAAFVFARVSENQITSKKCSKQLAKLERKINIQSEKLNNLIESIDFSKEYEMVSFPEGFEYFVYENNSIIYWSSNLIPLESNFLSFNVDTVAKLKNGWYYLSKHYKNHTTIIGAYLLSYNFKYNNRHLQNYWQNEISVLAERFSITERESNYKIKIGNNNSINLDLVSTPSINRKESIVITAYILSLILFIVFIKISKRKLTNTVPSWLLDTFGIVILITLRLIMFWIEFPSTLYETMLFSPYYYATSDWLPSLGDLLINMLLLLYVALILFKKAKPRLRLEKKPVVALAISTSAFLLIFIFASIAIDNIESLIINSNIQFNIKNVFTLNSISYLGFTIIALSFLLYVLIAQTIIKSICIKQLKTPRIVLAFTISLGLYVVLDIIYFREKLQFILPLVFVLALMIVREKKHKREFNFASVLLYVLIFSILTTFALNYYKNYKEKEYRKILAIDLSSEKDPVGESVFLEIEQNIKTDNRLKNTLLEYPQYEEEATRLINNHFKGYWSRYDILITLCDDQENLIIKPTYIETNCHQFFTQMVEEIGQHTLSSSLYYLENNSGRNSYLAIFDLKADTTALPRIMVELNSKYAPKDLGYPELLIDKRTLRSSDLGDYSYAKYKYNKLYTNYGKYFYNINLTRSVPRSKDYFFYDLNGYNHLSYKIDENSVIVISKQRETFLDIIAPFSYVFILFATLCFIFIVLVFKNKRFFQIQPNLKSRIQFSIIIVVLISFFLIGSGSIYYIYNIYNKKNVSLLSEKMHSLLVELEHKLANEKELTAEMSEYLTDLLIKFQNVFFTDINIFDLNGNLLASSRPKIFSEGLISDKINPVAFSHLKRNKQFFFMHEESIGDMSYLSAYVPFRNENNEHIAYLNLPYFAKQDELQDEISSFLVTFVNVYLLLIALAVIIALVISAYITKPLQLIKEKLSKIIYGKQNEKIEWNKSDELGSLIVEYNRMVDELVESAALLAQSERESAWREMAKQVAHEIKNPLTPMKLNVQYLQRAWQNKEPDWDTRLSRFTASIIEQIDTLSKIATEFSDFAKMPRTANQIIKLKPVLQNSIDLYIEDQNLSIKLISSLEKDAIIFADKEQLLRVFNNLIKNAIQAKQENTKCEININVEVDEQYYKISVADNGKGIPDELKGKIFSPNFTTKSSGMGLGLAMVHNIISAAGGKIDFESEKDAGSTFYIWLPIHKE